jgi:hypothetical protein
VLKKKTNSICHHVDRESAAMCESIMAHVSSENNHADMCTKLFTTGKKRYHIIGLLIYDLYAW